jgi:cytoskeletal protein CcmA (bactofilin family)
MPEPTTQQTTVIGADTKIRGDMTFDGTARILGGFEGSITAKGELQIAESANCKATVDAAKVMIEGTVEGNVTARERIELTAKARVKGDVAAAKLVVAEGATFIGHVTVGADAIKAARTADADAGHEVRATPPGSSPGAASRGEPKAEPALRR